MPQKLVPESAPYPIVGSRSRPPCLDTEWTPNCRRIKGANFRKLSLPIRNPNFRSTAETTFGNRKSPPEKPVSAIENPVSCHWPFASRRCSRNQQFQIWSMWDSNANADVSRTLEL